MLWKLFQLAIVFAVLISNAEYHWTPNSYVAGGLAVFAAFAATVLLGDLFRLLRWSKQLLTVLREESPRQGYLGRRYGSAINEIVRKVRLHRARH